MKRGIFCALFAYVFWGLHPIYWKLLGHVPSFEIVSHRVLWSYVFFCMIIFVRCADNISSHRNRIYKRTTPSDLYNRSAADKTLSSRYTAVHLPHPDIINRRIYIR